MTAVDRTRPSRPVVARHLLRTQLLGLEALLAGFIGVVALVGVAIHVFFGVSGSIWGGSIQFMRWFSAVMGVYLTAVYLPVYLAHGRTRREIAIGAAVFAAILAAWLGAAVLVGYALEAGLFAAIGWTDILPDPHPVGSLGLVATTFSRYAAGFLVWLAVGALGGAAFYRSGLTGAIAVPIGLALLALSEMALSPDPDLPDFLGVVSTVAAAPPLVGIAIGLAGALLAMALTWPIVRDIPMRSNAA